MIWWNLTAVAVGGFAGGCLRSLCSSWLNRSDYAIPFGTLLVNLAGSFIVGVMLAVTAAGTLGAPWKALVVTGFCGGLTTFSTFSADTFTLMQTNLWAALLIVLGNLAIGMLLYLLGRRLIGRRKHDADVV